MRILILGATGMLGHRLVQECAAAHDVYGTTQNDGPPAAMLPPRDVRFIGAVRVAEFDSVVRALELSRPEAVINCIGIVKQAAAAKDPLPSIAVNALFPHRLAGLCRAVGVRLIHLSTDCVFSGAKGAPYVDEDLPDPVDLYGRTKLLGEVSGPGCLTLRTSMIGRELGGRTGLVEWFLSQRNGRVGGYRRALFSGLTTPVLSRLICQLIERPEPLSGIWQVAADPISKYDLLRLLNEKFAANVVIDPDESFACDRRLDGSRFSAATGFAAPPWPDMIQELADEAAWYEQRAK